MAKTLIKIAIALIVLHGAFRVGSAYWNFYRYEDALLQIAQFGDRRTERQVCDEALIDGRRVRRAHRGGRPDGSQGRQSAVQLRDRADGAEGERAGSRVGAADHRGMVPGPPSAAAGLLLSVGVQTDGVGSSEVLGRATTRPRLTTAAMAGAPTRIRSTASPLTITASISLPGSRLPTSASRPIA